MLANLRAASKKSYPAHRFAAAAGFLHVAHSNYADGLVSRRMNRPSSQNMLRVPPRPEHKNVPPEAKTRHRGTKPAAWDTKPAVYLRVFIVMETTGKTGGGIPEKGFGSKQRAKRVAEKQVDNLADR